MVRLSHCLAGLILATASSISFAFSTHEFNNRHNYGNKYELHQDPGPWDNVNLNDFIVPNHNLNITDSTNGLPEASDPSQADININLSYGEKPIKIFQDVGQALDKKYKNFEYAYYYYKPRYDWLSYITAPPDNLNSYYKIINPSISKSLDWTPSKKLLNTVGDWASYNLVFQNLCNNTSFKFSLNLTNFNLKAYTDFGTIHFSSTNTSYSNLYSISDNSAHYYNDVATINFNQMIINDGSKVAQFNTVNAAAFFLNPINYHYWYQTYIDWYTFAKTYINWQNSNYVFYPKLLLSSSLSDLKNGVDSPYDEPQESYGAQGMHATVEYNYNKFKSNWTQGYIQQTDYDRAAMESGKNSSAFYYYDSDSFLTHRPKEFTHTFDWIKQARITGGILDETISQQVNCFVYKSLDNTKIYIDNQALVGADYMPRYYRFSFRTAGWPATTSFKSSVWENEAYPITSGFGNPAQTLINNITTTNFSYPVLDSPNIDLPLSQYYLYDALDNANNYVLGNDKYQPSLGVQTTFKLDSGSDILQHGENPAIFTFTFTNHPAWTATIHVNIAWAGSPPVVPMRRLIPSKIVIPGYPIEPARAAFQIVFRFIL